MSWLTLFASSGAPRGPYVVRQALIAGSHEQSLLLFQDSDDVSCSDRLDQQAMVLRQGVDLAGSHALELDEIQRVVRAYRYPLDVSAALNSSDAGKQCYQQLEPLLHATALISRRAFMSAGGFSTDRVIANDTQFMLRAFFTLRMANADEFLYVRRRHPRALTVAAATAAGHPLRKALSDEWSRDFHRVKAGAMTLADSSLRLSSTAAANSLVRLD
jgi:hypothetical protein